MLVVPFTARHLEEEDSDGDYIVTTTTLEVATIHTHQIKTIGGEWGGEEENWIQQSQLEMFIPISLISLDGCVWIQWTRGGISEYIISIILIMVSMYNILLIYLSPTLITLQSECDHLFWSLCATHAELSKGSRPAYHRWTYSNVQMEEPCDSAIIHIMEVINNH